MVVKLERKTGGEGDSERKNKEESDCPNRSILSSSVFCFFYQRPRPKDEPPFSPVAVIVSQMPNIKVVWLPIYNKVTHKCYTCFIHDNKTKVLLIALQQ